MRNFTELTPWSRVYSKCGMPPTTSAPMRIASSISSRPLRYDSMPSWGKATICMSTRCRLSSRTSSIAFSAVSCGSVTSTWVRTCWMPWAARLWRVFLTRFLVSSAVIVTLRSLQHSMPSNSVPLMFQRGSPAVSVASRWICGSTKGGITRLPPASRSSGPRVGASVCRPILLIRPFSRCNSCNPSWLRRRALMMCIGRILL
ncbi:hypothetical protein D3C87_1589270 [compost metagenome]